MKLTERLALYGAVVLLALLLIHQHDARVRAQALAQQRADSLHVVTVRQDSVDVRRAHDDSVARDSLGRLATRVAASDASRLRLSHRADSLVARLDSLVPRDTVLAIVALKDSAAAAQSDEIRQLEHGLDIFRQRLTAADSSRDAWKAIALNGQSQLAAAIKRSAARFACVGGVSVAGGFGGTAVGLGATCGIRI